MADETPPLEAEIRRRITITGPMPVAQYMTLCLTHPEYGYYMTRDPFGTVGDFTTSPEISQMFGELIGLWAGSVWMQMGSPSRVHLVELGPGRGSMMLDALRAAHVVRDFRAAVSVHFVEISPTLEERQRQGLSAVNVPVAWHGSLDEVPDGPVIIVANEFFDVLPVHQAVMCADGWHERVVKIDDDGELCFGTARDPIPLFEQVLPKSMGEVQIGEIFEMRADHVALEIGRRVVRHNGAALVIDYGHPVSATGDTLQAVGGHDFKDPLRSPGLVDLTAHVDFQALAQAAESMRARSYGPIEQGEFLRRMGIEARAAALKQGAPPGKATEIDAALARLTNEGFTGMGRMFKVMAFADPKLGTPPGFET
jgi:NADH dehydrogenase [ubiquinone] 1 alpha subcomplex assembly factor 7